MKKSFLPFLFILTTLYSNSCVSQEGRNLDFSKNVIHGSYGTVILLHSTHITYDRLLKTMDKGFLKAFYATLKIGWNISISYPSSSSRELLGAVGVTALTGSKKNHIEIGLGLGIADSKEITGRSNEIGLFIIPNVSVGFRRQIKKGLLFRAGAGYPEWFYIGAGYSF